MSTRLTEVLVHLDESVDEAVIAEIEQGIRQDRGVVSVGRRPGQKQLLLVVYDCTVARATSILHNFRERGLHAQLIGM